MTNWFHSCDWIFFTRLMQNKIILKYETMKEDYKTSVIADSTSILHVLMFPNTQTTT